MSVEILAPAGNYGCFNAAVSAGANAVYLGVAGFSARKNAEFTFEELEQALTAAHARGVKVYVALNTIVWNKELLALEETVKKIAVLGADGVIVQDLAAAVLVKKYGLPLHASTQLAVSDINGVLFAESFGFCRVVLARELSVSEIARIAAERGDIELEVFVYGARCASVSGLCYMSVAFSGQSGRAKDKRSGNRGTCGSPCRLDFCEICKGRKRHYAISHDDMDLTPHIREMEKIGVTSLKIEGRLKGEEYVRKAVRACVGIITKSC